jgi:hypothetical protein
MFMQLETAIHGDIATDMSDAEFICCFVQFQFFEFMAQIIDDKT